MNRRRCWLINDSTSSERSMPIIAAWTGGTDGKGRNRLPVTAVALTRQSRNQIG
jgi:hypothetical protein